MSLFGIRRGRNNRGTGLRIVSSPATEWRGLLTDRSVLSRLALGLVTVAALLVGVQGWQQTFSYRLGQRPVAGVAASIDFERVNPQRTNYARDRAAEQAPPVFVHDGSLLARLPRDLRQNLLAFVPAGDVSMLPAEVRRAFGLAAEGVLPPVGGLPAADRAETFGSLKKLASDEAQLKDTIADFNRFIQPLEQNGLLRDEQLPAADLAARGSIAVYEPEGEPRSISLAEVQLVQLLAPTGRLHNRWALFPALLPFRAEFEHWLRTQSPETLIYDDAATQTARQKVRAGIEDMYDAYYVGDLLVKPGEAIDESRLELLLAEHEQLQLKVTPRERVMRVTIVSLMLATLALLIGYHLVRHESKLVWNISGLSLYLGLVVVATGLARLLSYDPWRAELAPVLVAVMVCAVVYNQVLATLTAFALSLLVTISIGADLGRFTVLMSVCATAAILLPSVPSRSTLVVVGIWTAVVCFLMSWGTTVIDSRLAVIDGTAGPPLWRDPAQWFQSLRGAGWCLAAGFLVSGSLPFVEAVFGAVTDISLLELGDVSHPLLQELVRRAPGTYNHSITVASIGETAADAVGANGLLVRVGAYFHDIGKMLKPHYFVENMTDGENRHEHLAPAMSTLIIIGHVKDGADLALQHNLPPALIEFIEQHHGTTLVEFFYHEATKQAEEHPDHRTDAEESHFRYPGPKPQTREAAVLMIADAVEGASRTLSEPTPSRIERLVHDIAIKRLMDGQFDECGLTMTELSQIKDSLTKSLTAMYHGRVKYPEQRTA
ncbi:MAG: HDIG domain-containing protein [Planctomycetaceae bacterium]|nr:HDIG domain-containing protein [Planctomycetaceae bacterium]